MCSNRMRTIGIGSETLAHRLNHHGFDVRCRHASDAARLVISLLQNRVGNIVAVARATFVRVRWGHPVATVVEDPARKDRGRASVLHPPSSGTSSELRLHGLEKGLIHDGLMLSAVDLPAVDDFTDVE